MMISTYNRYRLKQEINSMSRHRIFYYIIQTYNTIYIFKYFLFFIARINVRPRQIIYESKSGARSFQEISGATV